MADKKDFDIESYYKNLSRVFKAGSPVVRQRLANKIMPPGQTSSPIGTARAFLKSTTNLYASQMSSYGMYSRLARYSDYCIDGNTEIYTPYGCFTIKELSEKYSGEKTFPVFAYDLKNKKIVCATAKNAHKTKIDKTIKLIFDDGSELICTPDHRVLMRNGEYKQAQNIQLNESVMPLYKREIYKNKYQFLISAGGNAIPEHRLVCEWNTGRLIKENEVVHHKNFIPSDNRPENLIFMDEHEHQLFHVNKMIEFNKTYWTEENREKHSKIMINAFDSDEYRKKRSEITKQIYSTPSGRDKQRKRAKDSFENGKLHTSKNFSNFWIGKVRPQEWKNERKGNKNPAWRHDLTLELIIESAIKHNYVQKEVRKQLNCCNEDILRRIRSQNFKNWKEFSEHVKEFNNHKVVKIEDSGVREVYDLEVPEYHNFAIAHNGNPTVFVHNSEMESFSIISSALDIYADEVCTRDEHGEMIKIFSHDQKIRKILQSFFYDVLNIDFHLWTWARNMCKYGDQFLLVDHHPNHGLLQLVPMPVNEVEREEGFDQNDPLAYRYRWSTQGNRTLDPWQVIHFRNGGNDNFMPYGSAIIEAVRRSWRQVVLLEDAVMTYRIVRSPERRVFYIDVGGIDPNDVPQFVEKVKGQLKRNMVVDQTTGQMDKRYNAMSIIDDYFIPVRGDMTSTRIESLAGGQYVGDIDDLNYHRDKLFAGLKIPKSYLGYESEVNARSTLSQEDINFARTIARLQNVIVAELNKMAIIQLFSAGYRGEELMNFDISMASPSIITEIQRLELWRTRFEVASVATSIGEGVVDRRFAYKKLFKLSDEEIEEIEEGRRKDVAFDKELEGIATPVEIPPEGAPGEETPAPEGQLNPGQAPTPNPPEGDTGEKPITTDSFDPNQQRIMPNALKAKFKRRKGSDGIERPNSGLKAAFNFKKTALDPRDGLIQNLRVGSTPFGEGKLLSEELDFSGLDQETKKQTLESRMKQHVRLLDQLEEKFKKIKTEIITSPPPVGEPIEPKDKDENPDPGGSDLMTIGGKI